MRTIAFIFLLVNQAMAQPPVGPTPQTAGDRRGDNISNYNVVNSWETGYRFSTVGGDFGQYRSTVNYSNGVRLLGSSLSVNSRDGHGRLFDQINFNTQGLGNDPYETVMLRVEKNRLYRYEMNWRQNDYFNPGLVTAGGGGQHLLDTRYRMQDHNLTLFPQSNLKFFLGMSTSSQRGPSYSSIELFNANGDIFPLFSDVRRVWREYRVGNEFQVLGIRVNWMRGWEDFKDNAGGMLASGGVPGAPPLTHDSSVKINSFTASDPYDGTSPYWRAAIFTDRRFLTVNGRFTYTAGRRAFVVDENAVGAASLTERRQQVITTGDADRPVATGNLNVNVTPSSKLSLVNSTSIYSIRTLGNSYYSQFDSPAQTVVVLFYNYLGIRTIANDTNVNYQASPLWGVTAGYHYSDRLIRSNEQFTFEGTVSNTPAEQTNQLHSADLGIRIRPWKPWSVILSAEIGRNSMPFSPIADRDYHVLNGRLQYRTETLQVTGVASANYNTNSVLLSSYGSQSRTYSVSGTWTPPLSRFSVDAGFSRLHTYTIGGIAYFLNRQLYQGQSSIYLSNINSIYAGVRYTLWGRADLYAGYTRVQDLGDGRSIASDGIGSQLPLFQSVQTFPVVFQSPAARVSVKITGKLRWNAGYQYYGYREDFTPLPGYRANTGYTSLSLSF
jgi:hypothetical protein